MALGLGAMLRRAGDDAAIVFVVTDRGGGPHPGAGGRLVLPGIAVARVLRRDLRVQGVRALDVLLVGPSSYRSYFCPDPACCPAEGEPLEGVMGSEVAAQMVLAGRSVAACEGDLLADVRAVPPDRQLQLASGPPSTGPGALEPTWQQWRQALAAGWDEPVDGETLLQALSCLPFRDAVLLSLVPGSGTAAERVLSGQPGPDAEGLLDRQPDPDLVERGRRLLAALARTAPPGRRAEPLAVLSWLSWWSGEGARARLLSERALSDQPGHRLAGLVAQLLARGVPPTWVDRTAG